MAKSKRSYDARATRNRILDAAMDIFQRRGYHESSMQELLAGAGVPAGSMYHYFPTKKSLAMAVARERVMQAVRETWIDAIRTASHPGKAVLGVFKTVASAIDAGATPFGCPVTNLAVELSSIDRELAAALNEAYKAWEDVLTDRLRETRSRQRAAELAAIVVATFAGAMSMAKSTNSSLPLKRCLNPLAALLS